MKLDLSKPQWINGDCLKILKKIPSGSIHLVVTSPPYGIGKEYEKRGINLELFHQVIIQLVRVLRKDGVICWQTGNYVSAGEIVPLDVITYPIFTKLKMKLVNRIIWNFNHGEHSKKRLSGRYETVMVFVKSADHYFNLEPIRAPNLNRGKRGNKPWNKGVLTCNPHGKNPGDVWRISNVKHNHPEKLLGGHPCQMPTELAIRLIDAYSPPGGLVFDPFGGAATVYISALVRGRIPISTEISLKYYKLAMRRIKDPISAKKAEIKGKRQIHRSEIEDLAALIRSELRLLKAKKKTLMKPTPNKKETLLTANQIVGAIEACQSILEDIEDILSTSERGKIWEDAIWQWNQPGGVSPFTITINSKT